MKYSVHNLQTGNRPAPAGYNSWIEYWEEAPPRLRLLLKATDGAHVQLNNPFDKRWYIVPMCHSHNCQFKANLTIEGPLVAATDPSIIRG